jgi:hypothetical protein
MGVNRSGMYDMGVHDMCVHDVGVHSVGLQCARVHGIDELCMDGQKDVVFSVGTK